MECFLFVLLCKLFMPGLFNILCFCNSEKVLCWLQNFAHKKFAQRFILDTFWGVHVLQELFAVSLLLSCFNLIVLTTFINCWVTHILCLFIFNVIRNYHFILSLNIQTMHAYFKFLWKKLSNTVVQNWKNITLCRRTWTWHAFLLSKSHYKVANLMIVMIVMIVIGSSSTEYVRDLLPCNNSSNLN